MVRVRSDYQEAISFAWSIGFRPVSVKQENRPEDKKECREILWMRHEREQAAPEQEKELSILEKQRKSVIDRHGVSNYDRL